MKCSISLLQNYSSSGVESKGAEVESWKGEIYNDFKVYICKSVLNVWGAPPADEFLL